MEYAIFLNGVFESVLEEIMTAQKKKPKLNAYLFCSVNPFLVKMINMLG